MRSDRRKSSKVVKLVDQYAPVVPFSRKKSLGRCSATKGLPLPISSMKILQTLFGFLGLFLAGLLRGNEPAPVIVTFGDSTTAARATLTVYATLLGERLRQELGVTVKMINAGVPSDTTRRGAARFEHDVVAKHPRLVIIQFGINDSAIDVWKNPPETDPRVPLTEYRERLEGFITACRERGISVVLMTPNSLRWSPRMLELYGKPPYDTSDPDGFNLNLRAYAAAMRELATETGTPLVDVMQAHDEAVKAGAPTLLSDGVHPNDRGHELVADLLMKLIRARPELLQSMNAQPAPLKGR